MEFTLKLTPAELRTLLACVSRAAVNAQPGTLRAADLYAMEAKLDKMADEQETADAADVPKAR